MIPEEELNTISIVNPYEKDLTATTFYISKRKKKNLLWWWDIKIELSKMFSMSEDRENVKT